MQKWAMPRTVAVFFRSLKKLFKGDHARFSSPSLDLCKNRAVSIALGSTPLFYLPFQKCPEDAYVGWGRRSGAWASRFAKRNKSNLVLLEDGLLRSFHRNDPTLSLVVDDQGIYYDAYEPSRMEQLIKEEVVAIEAARVEKLINDWRELKLSKYNQGSEYALELPENYILVIDQVRGDASIKYGMANAGSFQIMLKSALAENPGKQILLKMHPDILTRAKAGHFDVKELSKHQDITLITEGCLPSRLIDNADAVYTVTSQVGFEALMREKTVRCFGMPFYAGWGLTQDELPAPSRRGNVSLLALVDAALIKYPVYIDLDKGRVCEVEDIVAILAKMKSNVEG